MPCPHYNYDSPYEGDLNAQDLATEWLEIRRALAAQLVKSNGEIHHTAYCDAAVFQLKQAELRARLNLVTSASGRHRSVTSQAAELFRCGAFWITLALTKGGTSVARLIYIALIAVPLYAGMLSISSVTFQGSPCRLAVLKLSALVQELSSAAALFLAFGYTAFVGHDALEVALLTTGAALGLIWYALLAAVRDPSCIQVRTLRQSEKQLSRPS
jgi:hypothetical protein